MPRNRPALVLGAISLLALNAPVGFARPVPHPPHVSHPTAIGIHTPPAPRPGGGGGGRPREPAPHPPGPGPGPGPHPPGPPPGPGPHPPGPPPHPYPYYPPGPYWGWDNDFYWDHPVATAAAVGVVAGTAAAITEAALGTTVYSLPSSCVTIVSGNLTYFHCGTDWYQPRYAGSGVTYIVVNPPG